MREASLAGVISPIRIRMISNRRFGLKMANWQMAYP